jgi:plasmid stabilization system protein ParE
MRIRWTIPAADDLQNIKTYLQQNHPQSAELTVRKIYDQIRLLKKLPNRGSQAIGAVPGNWRSVRFRTSSCIP